MPAYDVVDRDTYDAPIKTQIELHAVVWGTLTELGLKQLLQKLYDEANATRGFKYHEGKPTMCWTLSRALQPPPGQAFLPQAWDVNVTIRS